MQVARINKIGLAQIAEAIAQHHKYSWVSRSQRMLNIWAKHAEYHFELGYEGCQFEISRFNTVTGQPVIVEITKEGYDVIEVDEADLEEEEEDVEEGKEGEEPDDEPEHYDDPAYADRMAADWFARRTDGPF